MTEPSAPAETPAPQETAAEPPPQAEAIADAAQLQTTRAVAVSRAQHAALLAARNMQDIVAAQLELIEGLATIGTFVARSGMFGPAVDTPEKGGILAMTAFELGLTLAQASRFIDIIEGKPYVRAKMKMALVNSRGPGRMYVTDRAADHVTARGVRPGFPPVEVTYRITDAKRANLLGKKGWQSDPVDMMAQRATGKLADILWPEVGAGLALAEDGEALDFDAADYEATVLDGEFREVTDPVDDPAIASVDALLDDAKANRSDRQRAPRPDGQARQPSAGATQAFTDLTAAMQRERPPLTMRDIRLAMFPNGNPNGAISAIDLDRWLFEGSEDDPRSVDGIIAEARRRRDRA